MELQESPHFGQPNELAHVRFKTRSQGGMNILSVEEMQSDLVQAVKNRNTELAEDASKFYDDEVLRDMEKKILMMVEKKWL